MKNHTHHSDLWPPICWLPLNRYLRHEFLPSTLRTKLAITWKEHLYGPIRIMKYNLLYKSLFKCYYVKFVVGNLSWTMWSSVSDTVGHVISTILYITILSYILYVTCVLHVERRFFFTFCKNTFIGGSLVMKKSVSKWWKYDELGISEPSYIDLVSNIENKIALSIKSCSNSMDNRL